MPGTFSNLSVHIVFSTKDRIPMMKLSVREVLFTYIGGVINGLGGKIIVVGGMPDHVHIVAMLPTNVSIADAVRTVKSNTSKWMNERTKDMKFGWQRGYGAFSVSQSAVPAVVQYVCNQDQHHRCRSFKEELKILLTRHGLDFDERFLC
jgi:REP element-mobilizing transposase RayT